jgi:hypothetical protein
MKGGFTRDYGKTTEDRITTPRTHRDQTSGMNYAECIKIIKNITDDIKAHMEAHPTERIQQKKTKREEYYMRILHENTTEDGILQKRTPKSFEEQIATETTEYTTNEPGRSRPMVTPKP